MDRIQFLDELEADFNKLQPYNKNVHIVNQEYASLSSWHETTKDLDRGQPVLPSSHIGIPVVASGARPKTTSAVVRRSGTYNDRRVATAEDLGGQTSEHNNFVKVDMTTMCSQGWNLSHGWFNRPKAVQIKDDVVEANIQKWASRLKKIRKKPAPDIAVIHQCFDEEDNRDRDSEFREEGNEKGLTEQVDDLNVDLRNSRIEGKPYSTPGPRYNLRSAASRITSKQVVATRIDDSTVRDIRFGTHSTTRGDSLRNSYLPKDSSKPPPSPASLQFMKVFESKRNFVGSIYEVNERVCGPGPGKYNTLSAYGRTSKIIPVTGTHFAPVRTSPEEMRLKSAEAKIPRYRPPKPLW